MGLKNKCIFSVDNKFVIRTWDSDMHFMPAQEIIGKGIINIFPALHNTITYVLANGKKKQIKNFRNSCFRGTNLTFDVHIKPVKDKRGKVKEAAVILDNISIECHSEKELADSEKMIAIGKVASTLAHGVRNPLNAIKGAVIYLTEKYRHETTLLEFGKIINDEISRLDSFISNFLSATEGETKFIPVNINDILSAILVMIKPRTEIQNIRILSNFFALPLVVADSFQIEQAFFNIINNAIEAMPDGGSIDIRTSLTWENNIDYAVVEISDTGKGISLKGRGRLGELSNNPKKHDKGYGIFLSREIIKAHNGKLLWESKRGEGTTFKIFLPVRHD